MAVLLRALGCTVHTHVPDRMADGYGPNPTALRMLADRGSSLIVCVDCGTAAAEALASVAGIADVVVLDHRKAQGPPPAVLATVNPNRLDDRSGLTFLCAAERGLHDRGRYRAGAAPSGFFRAAGGAGSDGAA